VGPYLTLFTRAGISRESADSSVAALQIHELPGARGCTYVVPACDFALALKLSRPFAEAEMNTARKLGVTGKEVDRLCAAVVKALGNGPLDPERIRDAVGPAARSLGEEGTKKGLTTTLPLALGRLQSDGEIRRIPVNGRLDQQRYKYTLWNPMAGFQASYEEAATEIARRYFSWTGPATLAEFQWFSGLGVKAARAAIEPLRLLPLDSESGRLMHPADLDRLKSFQPPKNPQYSLVASTDAIILLRRNLASLVQPGDLAREWPGGKGMRSGSGLTGLPCHPILDRGRVVGLWEFDTASGKVAWTSFGAAGPALNKAVALAETFIREQLGDARAFSLDSPKSREPRIRALRAYCV
jgi:hypothetical protein